MMKTWVLQRHMLTICHPSVSITLSITCFCLVSVITGIVFSISRPWLENYHSGHRHAHSNSPRFVNGHYTVKCMGCVMWCLCQ